MFNHSQCDLQLTSTLARKTQRLQVTKACPAKERVTSTNTNVTLCVQIHPPRCWTPGVLDPSLESTGSQAIGLRPPFLMEALLGLVLQRPACRLSLARRCKSFTSNATPFSKLQTYTHIEQFQVYCLKPCSIVTFYERWNPILTIWIPRRNKFESMLIKNMEIVYILVRLDLLVNKCAIFNL